MRVIDVNSLKMNQRGSKLIRVRNCNVLIVQLYITIL